MPRSSGRRRASASLPAASPLMWRGASGSCSQRIALPGGQRDGSSACGWPTQIVGVSGSMPRSASLQAFETPSRPGVRCSSATLPSAGVAPGRRAVERVVDLEIALAVAVFLRRRDVGFGRRLAEQPLVELRRRHRADDALRRRDRFARREAHAGGAAALDDDRGDVGAGADLAALFPDQRLEGGEQVLRAALDDRRAGGLQREGDDLGDLAGEGVLRPEPGMQHPGRPERAGRGRTCRRSRASRAPGSSASPRKAARPRGPRRQASPASSLKVG